MSLYQVVAGWTSPIDIELLARGDTPSGAMTGMTATLILSEARTGAAVTLTGTVSIPDTSLWSVRFSPATGDLVAGRYNGRVKVTDSASKIAYFPSGEPDIWEVRAVS